MNEYRHAAARWKRTRGCADSHCVEIFDGGHEIHVRNSKAPDVLVQFTPAEWRVFLAGVKRGDFD